jgi:mannose-1-phosphate guanylyltransferase
LTVIPALVLTAGLATRLRPLSLVRAKAALPVAGEALVRRILRQLAAAGVTDAVLNLHHRPDTLAAEVGDGTDLGVRVRYSWEGARVLGSAGGPRHALQLLDAPRFLILNGDTLSDLDLATVIRAHESSGALVTMAVVPNREPEKYSALKVDADGGVTGVVPRGSSEPSFHFYGVQVVESSVFASLPDDMPADTVGGIYPAIWQQQPGRVRAFITSAEYMDIGTPADYLTTSLTLAAREQSPLIGRRTHVGTTARIERSILWDDVEVGSGVFLRECIVTDGVRVPDDTSWHGVALRVADNQLAPGERRVDNLAVSAL